MFIDKVNINGYIKNSNLGYYNNFDDYYYDFNDWTIYPANTQGNYGVFINTPIYGPNNVAFINPLYEDTSMTKEISMYDETYESRIFENVKK